MSIPATSTQSVEAWRELHASGYFRNHRWYQDRLHDLGVAQVTRLLSPSTSDVLLEVGCGYGRLLWHLAPLVRSAIGVDIDEAPLAEARQLLASRDNVTVLRGDGTSLAVIGDASVDVACAFTVMQHLPRALVETYVRELRRVLVPGGRACLQFFFNGQAVGDVVPGVCEQSVSYSAAQVCAVVEDAGLQVASLERESLTALGYPPSLSWWWIVAQRESDATGGAA